MSDRTSAELFGIVFGELARVNDATARKVAKELFFKTRDYDFCTYQMYCDEALATLGLMKEISAKRAKELHPREYEGRYNDRETVTIYPHDYIWEILEKEENK